MNVLNKATIQSLKKNKIRTIVTIIGIILSAALICATTTFASSIYNYALQRTLYTTGDWHGYASVTFKDYKEIESNEEINKATYSHELGYAKINSSNDMKPYLYVIEADTENYFSTFPIHLLSGDFPGKNNEIIVPDTLSQDKNLNYKIGDKITLEIGERSQNGVKLGQNTPRFTIDYTQDGNRVLEKEDLDVQLKQTYTIVGFYEPLKTSYEGFYAPGYTAFTGVGQNPAEDSPVKVYFQMKDASKIYSFMEANGFEEASSSYSNNELLFWLGVSRYDNLIKAVLALVAIIILMIMISSISLIYNAFSISVSERTKQFGLLSSIGATKKQLRKSVLFEALFVSAIGIPLGLLLGIGGISAALKVLGDKFDSLGIFFLGVIMSPLHYICTGKYY